MTDHITRLKETLDPPGQFKPTRGNWVADGHTNWAEPMTEVRTEQTRDEGGHTIVRIHADFNCTVGKSEYEWANAAFVAAANPDAIRELLERLEQAEKDSRRYRFLRDNLHSEWAICEWCDDQDGIGYYRDGRAPEVVDAALDAAIASQEGGSDA